MDQHKEKLVDRLNAARCELLALISSLNDRQAAQESPYPGWTVKDVAAHLTAAERGHQQVIRALLAGQDTVIDGFDLDAFNEREVASRRGRSLAELLAELASSRAETLALLEAVGTEDWERAGFHPGGFDTTVEGVFRVIAIHEKRHAKDIRAVLLSAGTHRPS